jgi:hypothetical protein
MLMLKIISKSITVFILVLSASQVSAYVFEDVQTNPASNSVTFYIEDTTVRATKFSAKRLCFEFRWGIRKVSMVKFLEWYLEANGLNDASDVSKTCFVEKKGRGKWRSRMRASATRSWE